MALRNGLMAALVATSAAQTLATLAVYVLPILAPSAAGDLGVAPGLLGAQVALIYGTAALSSLLSGRVLARIGPAGCTQAALACSAVGAASLASGWLPAVVIGSLLLGIGYGLTTPAATQILTRLTPAARRNLVFSIKQMSVPLGGALAGLLLPSLALLVGWRGAAAGVALVLLVAVACVVPFRRSWPDERAVLPGSPRRLGTIEALFAGRGLVAIAAMGATFSAMQLSLGAFAVTTLVVGFGWGAVAAGGAAAAVQTSGAVARLVLAALADRMQGALPMLATMGFTTAAAALAMPFAVQWPDAMVLLLLCVFGASSAGWTGIALAEVARLAPPGAAGVAAGGVMAVTYGGVVLGPSLFAAAAALFGTYTAAFATMAAPPLAGAAVALCARRGA